VPTLAASFVRPGETSFGAAFLVLAILFFRELAPLLR